MRKVNIFISENLFNRALRLKKPEESDDNLVNRALMGFIIRGEEVREARIRFGMIYNKNNFLQRSKRASTSLKSRRKARKISL